MKEIGRLLICLTGLTLMSFLVSDILKSWKMMGNTQSPLWVIIPIVSLFLAKEFVGSTYVRQSLGFSERVLGKVESSIGIVLIILSILVLISLPFIWFGAIQTTIGGSR